MNKYINTCPVLGVNVAITDMKKTIEFLTTNLENLRGEYVCVSNSHTVVMAHDDDAYMHVQNNSVMVLPDGKPLSIIQKLKGNKLSKRVCGPELMAVLVEKKYNNYRHFFYGSTNDTLKLLEKKIKLQNPDVQIAGMYSPPFRPLTDEENTSVVEMINNTHPDFVWVGLGAPKQELWMYDHSNQNHINGNNSQIINGLMLGVGAAFDFQAGVIKRAPQWMQNLCLEWLYRLFQDPKRLFRRYFVTNTKFIFYSIIENYYNSKK